MKTCKKSLKNIFILPKKHLMLLRYSNFCTRLFSLSDITEFIRETY